MKQKRVNMSTSGTLALKGGVPFDDNLTLDGNLERGWINLSSTEIFMNMQIGRDGTIRPIPFK